MEKWRKFDAILGSFARAGVGLSPDGVRYVCMTQERSAMPFHLRWAIPALCGTSPARWVWMMRVSLAAVAILSALYAQSPWMACVALLPGISLAWRLPVLVDAPAMALSLGAAVALPFSLPVAVALAVAAGCVRETAPVWAAIYAWNPILLVGMVPVAVRWLIPSGQDVLDAENAWILAHPVAASRKYHAGHWLDGMTMAVPWGGLLVGVASGSPRLLVAMCVAYAQVFVATDSVRLYQWAAPVLAAGAVNVVAPAYLPLVAIAVAFNPWRGSGV